MFSLDSVTAPGAGSTVTEIPKSFQIGTTPEPQRRQTLGFKVSSVAQTLFSARGITKSVEAPAFNEFTVKVLVTAPFLVTRTVKGVPAIALPAFDTRIVRAGIVVVLGPFTFEVGHRL